MKEEVLKESPKTAEMKALEKLDTIDKILFQLLERWDSLTPEAVKEAFLKIARLNGQAKTELVAGYDDIKQKNDECER
jgi:hypothetical protein